MYTLQGLMNTVDTVQCEINGQWVSARPIRMRGLLGLLWRLRDAWAVLTGKADAFLWPMGQ